MPASRAVIVKDPSFASEACESSADAFTMLVMSAEMIEPFNAAPEPLPTAACTPTAVFTCVSEASAFTSTDFAFVKFAPLSVAATVLSMSATATAAPTAPEKPPEPEATPTVVPPVT